MVAIVTEDALPKYTEAYKGAIKRAWETGQTQTYWEFVILPRPIIGVIVRLRGVPRIWEVWPKKVIEKI